MNHFLNWLFLSNTTSKYQLCYIQFLIYICGGSDAYMHHTLNLQNRTQKKNWAYKNKSSSTKLKFTNKFHVLHTEIFRFVFSMENWLIAKKKTFVAYVNSRKIALDVNVDTPFVYCICFQMNWLHKIYVFRTLFDTLRRLYICCYVVIVGSVCVYLCECMFDVDGFSA